MQHNKIIGLKFEVPYHLDVTYKLGDQLYTAKALLFGIKIHFVYGKSNTFEIKVH